jgi:hypothetical protein
VLPPTPAQAEFFRASRHLLMHASFDLAERLKIP